MLHNEVKTSNTISGDFDDNINSDTEKNEVDEGANKSIENDDKEVTEKVKSKRIIRNPQPKFNEELLRGHRGLTALSRVFKRVNMKGRGKEKEDLSTILRTYSYWCHRMFPKYPFSDCVDKLEKLGSKKRTMVYMQRIRMGLFEDNSETQLPHPNLDDNDDTNNINNVILDDSHDISEPVQEIEMTDEIMERIRKNRERALQLRTSKLTENEVESADHNETFDDQLE